MPDTFSKNKKEISVKYSVFQHDLWIYALRCVILYY